MTRYELAIKLAYQAGEEVLKYFGQVKSWTKDDSSPLSEADLAANNIICSGIKKYFSQDGILSEEEEDSKERLTKKTVWIIDPIDGTANFIRQENDFCIMIAIVTDNVLEFGVTYLPTEDKLFIGGVNYPARLIIKEEEHKIQLPNSLGKSILTSKDYFDKKLTQFFNDNQLIPQPLGSAGVKVCNLLSNNGQHYIHTSDVKEWDTAAVEAIYNALGGKITNRWGEKNTYNKPQPIIEGIIVTESLEIQKNAIDFFKKLQKTNQLKRNLL